MCAILLVSVGVGEGNGGSGQGEGRGKAGFWEDWAQEGDGTNLWQAG